MMLVYGGTHCNIAPMIIGLTGGGILSIELITAFVGSIINLVGHYCCCYSTKYKDKCTNIGSSLGAYGVTAILLTLPIYTSLLATFSIAEGHMNANCTNFA